MVRCVNYRSVFALLGAGRAKEGGNAVNVAYCDIGAGGGSRGYEAGWARSVEGQVFREDAKHRAPDEQRLESSGEEYRLRIGEGRARFNIAREAQAMRIIRVLPQDRVCRSCRRYSRRLHAVNTRSI